MKEEILSSIKDRETFKRIEKIYTTAPVRKLSDEDKIVIFSDLHMGNRRRVDDFRGNSDLFYRLLKDYYWPRGYTLILNGDIEELQKFNMPVIRKRWNEVFKLLEDFHSAGRLIKIIGNHDLELSTGRFDSINADLLEALRYDYKGQTIFLLHGHQAADIFHRYNDFVGFMAKYLAYPLGIKNRTAAHNSKRKYTVERRIYRFSYLKKIVSIIGHTHRPLFEGLNKRDSLRFSIERLLRDYPEMDEKEKTFARSQILVLKDELENLENREKNSPESSFYHSEDLVLPNLFNSGAVIGKHGATGLEIERGNIRLVHWFDESVRSRKRYMRDVPAENLPGTTYNRRTIKQDHLEYIFNRITLLGWVESMEEETED
ncbi:metallophosphoesterase [Marispirochaeta aestuarii]|uniref:metallophosphoesterase n=1 Tax=Marispirochaeta aestuarii TaxID=1963862 RepID=UPI0029C9401A|nr:metallophosphoesterase [Marispirochaeta aestuarii]